MYTGLYRVHCPVYICSPNQSKFQSTPPISLYTENILSTLFKTQIQYCSVHWSIQCRLSNLYHSRLKQQFKEVYQQSKNYCDFLVGMAKLSQRKLDFYASLINLHKMHFLTVKINNSCPIYQNVQRMNMNYIPECSKKNKLGFDPGALTKHVNL